MAADRPTLDIQKSSADSYRNVSVIADEAAKAEKMLAEKSKETMTSQELKDLGITFNEKSDYTQSQEFLNAALGKVEHESLPEDAKNLLIAECYYGLANCERELGRLDQAIELFKKAKMQSEKISGEIKGFHDLAYLIARNVGIAYLILENPENAVHSFSDAVAIAKLTGQVGRIPAVKSYLGLSLVLTGNATPRGFQELEEARSLYPKNGREESMDWAAHRYHMARAFETAGDSINALAEYAESRRLRMQMIDPAKIGSIYYHSRLSDSNAGMGRVCLVLRRRNEAEKYLRDALLGYQALGATKKADAIRTSLSSEASPLSVSTQTSSSMFHPTLQQANTLVSLYKTPSLGSPGGE